VLAKIFLVYLFLLDSVFSCCGLSYFSLSVFASLCLVVLMCYGGFGLISVFSSCGRPYFSASVFVRLCV
jgi:hypothetical protein